MLEQTLFGDMKINLGKLELKEKIMKKIAVLFADGTEETLQVKASDVFVLESEESLGTTIYTLADVKAFGDYQATDIIAVEVPNGISKINFANDNETLKKISICDYATVSIVSFATSLTILPA